MSRYTLLNKYIDDDYLVYASANVILKKIDKVKFDAAGIKDLTNLFLSELKVSIEYKFIDYADPEVQGKYGIKNNCLVFAKRYPDNKYYIWFNKNIEAKKNRVYLLLVFSQIWFEMYALEETKQITEAELEGKDALAYTLAKRLSVLDWYKKFDKKEEKKEN